MIEAAIDILPKIGVKRFSINFVLEHFLGLSLLRVPLLDVVRINVF